MLDSNQHYEVLRADLKRCVSKMMLSPEFSRKVFPGIELQRVVEQLILRCETDVWETRGKKSELDIPEVSYMRPSTLWDECKFRCGWISRVFGPPKLTKVVVSPAQKIDLIPMVRFPVLPADRDGPRLNWVNSLPRL